MDKELQTIICWSCGHAIVSDVKAVFNHLKKKHSPRRKTLKNSHPILFEDLKLALDQHEFSQPEDVRQQPMDRNPVPGVEIQNGLYCPIKLEDGTSCSEVRLKTSSMYAHIIKDHSSQKGQFNERSLSGYQCDCQTIFTANHRKYFRVKLGTEECLKSEISDLPGIATGLLEPYKDEELPSILRTTQWHIFIQEFRRNPKDIVRLIEHPAQRLERQSGEDSNIERALGKLPKLSNFWMGEVHKQWVNATDFTRRMLYEFPV